jgi:hypothetical protein
VIDDSPISRSSSLHADAIDDDGLPTEDGKLMAELPLEPTYARSVYVGGCLYILFRRVYINGYVCVVNTKEMYTYVKVYMNENVHK